MCKSTQSDKGSLGTFSDPEWSREQEESVSRLRQYLAHLLKQAYPEQEKLSLAVPRHQQAWRCFRGRCPYLHCPLT